MKFVLNKEFGGFHVPEEVYLSRGYENSYDMIWDFEPEALRVLPDLVEFVELRGGQYNSLKLMEIPDEATDWKLSDYDGIETLYYCIDGKIKMV